MMPEQAPAPLTLEALRSFLAPRLADSVLHELRNPLNALNLQCDLLGRALEKAGAAEGAARARIAQMKERLKDLHEQQNSAVALWLSAPQSRATPQPLRTLLERSIGVLRSYCAQRELSLRAAGLAASDGVSVHEGATALQLAVMTAVVCACDQARVANASLESSGERTIELSVDSSGPDGVTVEVVAPLAQSDAFRELGFNESRRFLAALAELLATYAISLKLLDRDRGLRFSIPR